MTSQLEHAYDVCRGITRSAAKNFFYAFLVLPKGKRDALCAVYAFMRHSDDICDAPGLSLEQRKEKLAAWLDALHRVLAGESSDDPVLLAVADAQKNFSIRPELFDQLVYGTSMDLPAGGSGEIIYRTFDDLQKYCYYVASVVGLVAIRIFGYRDPQAEPLAEQCGIAFQLTNILRDVKEDAGMGRIYLPEEDLARFGRSPTDLDPARLGNGAAASFRPVLQALADRARSFYAAANDLMPLIDEDSRPALWTLVEIYRRLLEKIARRDYDVFSERVQLTVPEKLGVLSRGFLLRLTA